MTAFVLIASYANTISAKEEDSASRPNIGIACSYPVLKSGGGASSDTLFTERFRGRSIRDIHDTAFKCAKKAADRNEPLRAKLYGGVDTDLDSGVRNLLGVGKFINAAQNKQLERIELYIGQLKGSTDLAIRISKAISRANIPTQTFLRDNSKCSSLETLAIFVGGANDGWAKNVTFCSSAEYKRRYSVRERHKYRSVFDLARPFPTIQ